MEPDKLVCPTVATAWQAPRRLASHQCEIDNPAARSHLADAADHDAVDHHRRIGLQRADVGEFDVIHAGIAATSSDLIPVMVASRRLVVPEPAHRLARAASPPAACPAGSVKPEPQAVVGRVNKAD